MIRPAKLGAIAALASLGLAAGSGAVSAQSTTGHHGHPGFAPLTGTVQSFANGSLTVTTTSGSQTVTVNSSTRVVKFTPVNLSQVKAGTFVRLHFASGSTTTVDAVQVRGLVGPAHSGTSAGKPAKGTWTHTGAPGTAVHANRPIRGGQFVGASNGSITIKGFNGQQVTYTLSPNATVTELAAGTSNDLHSGETVAVFAQNGTALEVTILK